jgi:ubiquinone/menaquinone biosynthesis C-methylase UbiE
MTVEDEDKPQQAPSDPPRVPSPTPPPPDLAMLDQVAGPFPDDPIAALAAIVTPAPRPVEEDELRPEDAIDPTPDPPPRIASQPDFARAARASQPDIPRPMTSSHPDEPRASSASSPNLSRASSGSQPDRSSQTDGDAVPAPEDSISPDSSKPAAIAPDAAASRRARARITLRIPDDDVPGSTSPQPPSVDAPADESLISPLAVVQAMKIIAVGEPVVAAPAAHDDTDEPRGPMPSDADVLPLGEGDMQSVWTPGQQDAAGQTEPATSEAEEEVEPEPDDEPAAPAANLVVVPTPLPPPPVRARMASVPPANGASPGPHGYGPLPPVEPPRPRMGSIPPLDRPTPSAPPVGAYGPLPPVEPPRPRMGSIPPLDRPTPSAPPVGAYGPLPPVDPPRPRMGSLRPTDTAAPVAPPVALRPAEAVELADEDVSPDSTPPAEREPATQRAPSTSPAPPLAAPLPAVVAPPKPTPSPPQAAPVVVSAEDVLAAVSPLPSLTQPRSPSPPPASVEEVQPEADEEAQEVEAEAVVEPPPAPAPRVVPPEPKPPRKPLVDQEGAGRRRVRAPWEEIFSDDFVRAFPRLTPQQVAMEATFVEESLGVQKGGVILDLACGAGQHAVELASRGYNIVGYDLSLTMLALAADEAQERGQKINFLQGDMREMAFEEMFDAVYCWSTSFGFFDEDKNASVLRRVHRALRQSGMFLLDLVNRDFVVPRLPSLNWFEGDGCVCIDDAQFDSITSRLKVKRTIMREDGKSREVEYSLRLYSLHEIGKMLHDAGFKVVEVSGHPATAGVYFGADSPRMIILSERR